MFFNLPIFRLKNPLKLTVIFVEQLDEHILRRLIATVQL